MAGLKQFRNIPRNLMEWSRWMRDQDLENGLGNPDATERVLTSSIDGERDWVRRFDQWPGQFRGGTDQQVTTSAATLDLAVTDYDPGSKYSLEADTVIVETAGYYEISYSVFAVVASTSGATRGSILTWLENGAGVVPGSYSADYCRETVTNIHAGTSCILLMSAGDFVRVRVQMNLTVDVDTVADRCSLTIKRVR